MTHRRGTAVFQRVGMMGLTAALLAGAGAITADAAGPMVLCGATLNRDTVLTHDLYCPGRGVTLGPGVTLDLRGFKLQGNTTGTAITVPVGDHNAVINGRIRDFATAVDFQPNPQDYSVRTDLVLRRLTISAASIKAEAADVTIEDSRLTKAPVEASNTTITANRSTLTVPGEQPVFNGEMNHFIVNESSVFGRVNGDENQDLTVIKSTLDGKNTTHGAAFCAGSKLEIRLSTVKHYAQPMNVGCEHAQITGNTFHDNPNGALHVYGGDTLARVVGNTFRTNGGAALDGEAFLAAVNVFERNSAAIRVDGSNYDSRILNNQFRANTGTGLEVSRGYVRIGNNMATGNGGYGIYAPNGYDLGGNVASGNAEGNCVGVVCTAS